MGAGRAVHAGAAAQSKVQGFKGVFVSCDLDNGVWIGRDEVAEVPCLDIALAGTLGHMVVHGEQKTTKTEVIVWMDRWQDGYVQLWRMAAGQNTNLSERNSLCVETLDSELVV